MAMLETVGYDGFPLYVNTNKIMGISAKKTNLEQTIVIMSCESANEEWTVNESISTLLPKIENYLDKNKV